VITYPANLNVFNWIILPSPYRLETVSFPIQNSPKQGDALLPLLLNFAFQYNIRKTQENKEGRN
jgi:hypothetical protein